MNQTIRPEDQPIPEPKYVFILSGGIGAGKTAIVRRLVTDFHFVTGSPADVMKEALARHIAMQYEGDDESWAGYFNEMVEQSTKVEYRALLQAFGEFFSNRNKNYWAEQCVEVAEADYRTMAMAGIPSGIVFDSIRRDSEIMAVKNRWPKAIHIRLHVEHDRQIDYLTSILGYTEAKAEDTLAHSSEHWLDDMGGTEWDAQYVIDANGGDEKSWIQMMGIVTLAMDGATLQLAAAITEEADADNEG